jgi:hypothetical protein
MDAARAGSAREMLKLAVALHVLGFFSMTCPFTAWTGFPIALVIPGIFVFLGWSDIVRACARLGMAKGYARSIGAYGLLHLPGYWIVSRLPDKHVASGFEVIQRRSA